MTNTTRFPACISGILALLAAGALTFEPRTAIADGGTAAVTSQTQYECPGCLRPIQPDADRCPGCGLSFKKIEYEFPKCKATVSYDVTTCPNCGLVFDAPAPGEKASWRLEYNSLFANPKRYFWIALLGGVFGMGLVGFIYALERGRAKVGDRILLACLRAGTLFLLLVVFLPQVRLWFDRQSAPHVVVIVDDSLSMSAQEKYGDPNDREAADKLVEEAARLNSQPMCNVYIGAALRHPHTAPFGRAEDSDAYALTCGYVDLDDPGAATAAKDIYGPNKPTMVVVTGRAPHVRALGQRPLRCRAHRGTAIGRAHPPARTPAAPRAPGHLHEPRRADRRRAGGVTPSAARAPPSGPSAALSCEMAAGRESGYG